MPTKTAKKAKKTTRPAAKKARKKPALTASHKKALAEGRAMSSIVDHYLVTVNTPKPRGRKVSKADLVTRLAKAQTEAKNGNGIGRLLAAQDVRDLKARIHIVTSMNGSGDHKGAETAFVKIAKTFGDKRGITYGAWRDAGVPAPVLKRAGIARTREK